MGIWNQCASRLKGDLTTTEYNTWILPLQATEENGQLKLYAPNHFVMNWVVQHYEQRIMEVYSHLSDGKTHTVLFKIGTLQRPGDSTETKGGNTPTLRIQPTGHRSASNLNPEFTFDTLSKENRTK